MWALWHPKGPVPALRSVLEDTVWGKKRMFLANCVLSQLGGGRAAWPPEPQGVILGLPLPHPSVTERHRGWPRGTVPQGHGLAVTGPPPNACLSNCKGNQEKLEIKERKELIRILAQPQWLCFRRADTTRSLMPVLRGLRKEVGFGRCSGAFLVDVSAF